MSWWSLGAEEDEQMETPPPPVVGRRPAAGGRGPARGGAGRVPGGRGAGRGAATSRPRSPKGSKKGKKGSPKSKKAKMVNLPDEEAPSLFTSIGRMMNAAVPAGDESTIGTAKYPSKSGVPIRANTNANEAQRRANEMANAMAWLTNPAAAAAAAAEEPEPAPGSDIFTGSDNWWEQDQASTGADDISLFSNNTDFKTEEMPDLMSLLRQRQEDTVKDTSKSSKKSSKKSKKAAPAAATPSTLEAEANAKRLGDTLKWWNETYQGADKVKGVSMIGDVDSMKTVIDWWAANKDYKPPSHKKYDKDTKKAMKVKKSLQKYQSGEMIAAEKKAKELEEAVRWWQNQGSSHVEEAKDFEYNLGTFKKVNALFGQWKLKGTTMPDWEKYDPRDDPKDAEGRAKDLQGCLSMILSGAFDKNDPLYNSAVINNLKDLFADWKFKENDSAKELEDALNWWKKHAGSYDPLTATDEEADMFLKCKRLMAMFGLKEGDSLDKRNKEMQEALALWAKYKDTPLSDLDEATAAKMKMVKDALLQIKRDGLSMDDMKYMAKEMDEVLSWYLEKGYKIEDLSKVSKGYNAKFKKAQGLLSLWGMKAEPTPEQLKEIAESLIYLRRNGYKPEIFDTADGEEGAKFRRLQQAMVDWRLRGAEADTITSDEGDAFAREIESALDWFAENGESFDVKTANKEQIFAVERVKKIIDSWKPREAGEVFSWSRSKKPSKEIKDAISLYRDTGKIFDVGSLNVKPTEREALLKLQDAMLEWRRNNATNISEVEAEQTVKEMISAMNWYKTKGKEYDAASDRLESVPAMVRHKQVSEALDEFHNDLGSSNVDFKHLSRREQNKVAKELDEAMGWWQRNGKKVDTKEAEKDAEMFGQAQILGQLWQKANMSRKDIEEASDEVLKLINWMRKKSKSFDFDSVFDPKADMLQKLFQTWTGKKERNPKAVAKDVEDSISWWRNNNFSAETDSPIPADASKTEKLVGLVRKYADLKPNEDESADNLNWFRKENFKEISESLKSYQSDQPASKVGPAPVALSEEQKRANEMASALDWLRSNDAELDIDDEMSVALSVATFKKIDALMPKSGEADAPTTMGSALDWLRSKTDVDDETVNSFKKIDTVLNKSGASDSIKEGGFGGALDWLRKRQAEKAADAESDDASGGGSAGFGGVAGMPKSDEEKRAEQMASALDWLRSNDAAEEMSVGSGLGSVGSGLGSVGSFLKVGTDGSSAPPSALDWLRSQAQKEEKSKDDASEGVGSINARPMSAEEKRANDMDDALAWLRKNDAAGVDIGDEDTAFSSMDEFKPISAVSGAEKRAREMDDALAWMRSSSPDDADDNFSALGGQHVRPKSAEEKRAEQMNNALDWLRTNGANFDDDDMPDFSKYDGDYGKVYGRTDEEIAQERERALDWLRDKDPNALGGLDDPFSSVAPKSKEEKKADEMANALAWLRGNGADFSDEDAPDFSFETFDVDGFKPTSQADRAREMSDALGWLRGGKGGSIDDVDDADAVKFKKIDAILPSKEGQSAEDRAKEMENALNWLRSNGIDLDSDDMPIDSFDKLGFVPAGLRSAEEREKDRAGALDWLRSVGTDSEEEDSAFSKLDQLLPKKPNQSKDERAKEMENALNWLRQNGVDVYDEDGAPSFEKLSVLPAFGTKSGETYGSDDFDAVLSWLRADKDGKLDPNGIFKQLDLNLPKKEGQSAEDRANEIANALMWMRTRGLVADFEDSAVESMKPVGSAATSTRSPKQRSKDLENILVWMRKGKGKGQKKEDKYDPSGEFRKLDSMLPKKKGQTPEDRALEIEGSLDWLRSQGVAPVEDEPTLDFSTMGSMPVCIRTPEQRQEELNNAMNWMRNKGKGKKDKYDPTGEFRKLDKLLPKKRGQTSEERAREIEGFMDWMRNCGVSTSDATGLPSFETIGTVPVSRRTPEQRAKDLSDVMNWMRQKGKADEATDPTGDFRKLDSMLEKKGQSPEDRAREIESSIDWVRHPDRVDDAEDDSSDGFAKLGTMPVCVRTPEQRLKDLNNAMDWMRKGKKEKYDTLGEFRKIDQLLPKKKDQSPEDRAREIEGALDWLRNKGVSAYDPTADSPFSKMASAPMSHRTPEQRAKDLQDVLNWMRNKGKDDDKLDPTGDFRKLDATLPKKRGQKGEARARMIEGALDWCRSPAGTPYIGGESPSMEKLPFAPVSRFSPEQRAKDLGNALNWLRSKGKDGEKYDPTGEFRRLDAMLPKKRGQSTADRAREMEGALDWMRNNGVSPTDDSVVEQFKKVGTVQTSRRTPEQRGKDLADALNWLRNKGKDDDVYDPTEEFRKLDSVLPTKKKQTAEDRAREIEGALDWMRAQSVGQEGEGMPSSFDKVGSIGVSRRTPEQRAKDLQDTLNWLRNKGNDDEKFDPTGDFRKLDSALPKKKGQTREQRAREIEGALDWTRDNGVSVDNDEVFNKFQTAGSIPVSRRTPEQRAKDLNDALNWMRNKGKKDSLFDPTEEFRKLDMMLPKKVGQSAGERAREIESALDWLRSQSVGGAVDEGVPPLETLLSLPISRRTPEQREHDIDSALNWLRNGKKYSDDPTGDFKRIDQLLPTKQNQTHEDRAREIEGALDWMRNNNVSSDDTDAIEQFKKLGGVSVSKRTPEQRAKDLGKALSWLRNKGKNDDVLDPTSAFRKIDSCLPQRRNQTAEDRAREIEGAMDWMRNNGISTGDLDAALPQFSKLGSVPVSRRSPEERQGDSNNILNWLRNGKAESFDPTGEFKKIDQMLPQKKSQKPEDRARDIEGALDWMRNKGVAPSGDDGSAPGFSKVGSVPISRRTPEQRKKDLDNALTWMRNGKPESDDPTGDFKRIDQLLPSKRGQNAEDRAREIEGALDWMRNKGVSPVDDSVPGFSPLEESAPITRRSPEERAADLDGIMNWMRNGKRESDDPTGEFARIDQMLPKKRGQSKKDRAKDIEGTLNWFRNGAPSSEFEDEVIPEFEKMGSVPLSKRSPEDRLGDVDDILTWIRSGKRESDDPIGEFQKVDQLLPQRKRQSPRDRARDIEGALDWMRNNGISLDDDDISEQFEKLGSVPVSRRTPEDREKEQDDILSWLRNGKSDSEDPTGDFKRVDQMLPKKKKQSPKDRAREIEGALDWMRNNGVSPADDDTSDDFKKLPSIP
eukprot:scaffold3375_cov153-Cylindrotheca_fusiformis.AAC.8